MQRGVARTAESEATLEVWKKHGKKPNEPEVSDGTVSIAYFWLVRFAAVSLMSVEMVGCYVVGQGCARDVRFRELWNLAIKNARFRSLPLLERTLASLCDSSIRRSLKTQNRCEDVREEQQSPAYRSSDGKQPVRVGLIDVSTNANILDNRYDGSIFTLYGAYASESPSSQE